MHYFKDAEDGLEYLYANSEPDHAHVWFPCFDQPDLKAPYTLVVLAPKEWTVVATAPETSEMHPFTLTEQMKSSFGEADYV